MPITFGSSADALPPGGWGQISGLLLNSCMNLCKQSFFPSQLSHLQNGIHKRPSLQRPLPLSNELMSMECLVRGPGNQLVLHKCKRQSFMLLPYSLWLAERDRHQQEKQKGGLLDPQRAATQRKEPLGSTCRERSWLGFPYALLGSREPKVLCSAVHPSAFHNGLCSPASPPPDTRDSG